MAAKPVEPDLALHQSLPDLLRYLLRNPVEPDLALQSLPDLLRNLLRNPVEPDLALHQSLPDLHQNLLRNPVEPDLALHRSLPDLLRNLLRNLPRNPVEPDLALHQGFLEPSPEPCSTWPGSARLCTKAPQTFSGTFSGTFCTKASPDLHQNLPGTLLNLTRLCTEASPTFFGTFSGTLLNLTWLCTKASPPFSGNFSGTLLNWPGSAPKASQTFSGSSLNLTRRLHQCTPELFWAEDPISVHRWGKSRISDEAPLMVYWPWVTMESGKLTDQGSWSWVVPPKLNMAKSRFQVEFLKCNFGMRS